jgi:molybdopterin-guanine dinucleotide biosynthesis protein B
MIRCPVPLLGFCAWSGTGKTTLLTRLIPLLRAQQLRIAVIKHAHHGFDIDQPGKDSWILRKAGAEQTIVASRKRIALIHERPGDQEPTLAELLGRLDLESIDLVLVEGFKQEIFPKIELHRPSMQRPLLCGRMRHIIAVASDQPLNLPRPLPLLALNQPGEIADFIRNFCDDEQLRLSL